MDDLTRDHLSDADLSPSDAIARLEQRIEALHAKLESCRKFSAAGRFALALGSVLFLGMIVGLVAFDALAFLGAIVAVLGGLVMLGSNRSTRHQAEQELADAEAERAELIGGIDLRVVEERPTLH